MRNCGPGFLMKLASRPVKPPKFPAARAVQGAAPPPPGGGAAPPQSPKIRYPNRHHHACMVWTPRRSMSRARVVDVNPPRHLAGKQKTRRARDSSFRAQFVCYSKPAKLPVRRCRGGIAALIHTPTHAGGNRLSIHSRLHSHQGVRRNKTPHTTQPTRRARACALRNLYLHSFLFLMSCVEFEDRRFGVSASV